VAAVISHDELRRKIDSGEKFTLVDALQPGYYHTGHLPGAINIPVGQVAELAPTMLPDKNADIVVYCGGPTCNAAEKAATELAALGYTSVRDYKQGKQGWKEAGGKLESGSLPASIRL